MITIIIAVFGVTMDEHAIIGNPMLMAEGEGVEKYKIRDVSPCIDAGVVIEDNGEYDYGEYSV